MRIKKETKKNLKQKIMIQFETIRINTKNQYQK